MLTGEFDQRVKTLRNAMTDEWWMAVVALGTIGDEMRKDHGEAKTAECLRSFATAFIAEHALGTRTPQRLFANGKRVIGACHYTPDVARALSWVGAHLAANYSGALWAATELSNTQRWIEKNYRPC